MHPSRIVKEKIETGQHQHIVWKTLHKKKPTNWLDALKNNTFKESLIRYLVEAWKNLSFGPILKGKVFYANLRLATDMLTAKVWCFAKRKAL